MVLGIDFKQCNEIYGERGKNNRSKSSKSAANVKRKKSEEQDDWLAEPLKKKVDKKQMNALFNQKRVKEVELTDQGDPEKNKEMFE